MSDFLYVGIALLCNIAVQYTMQNTIDLTRTGARNIPSAPSLLDRARKQARLSDKAVIYLRPFGVGVALPTDSADGSIWLYDSNLDAQAALVAAGWEFEQLADVALVGGVL